MKLQSLTQRRLKAAGLGAFFRPRDLAPLDVSFRDLQRLVAAGTVEQVGRGLYRLEAVEPGPSETVAMVATAVPHAIICLLSALYIHGMGTQMPQEVWVALDRKARKPTRVPARLHIVRFSGVTQSHGIQVRQMLGVPVRITSPARTVVDCFRYRNKIGLDIALEALRESVHTRTVTIAEIGRVAKICHAGTVIRPYLEALVR